MSLAGPPASYFPVPSPAERIRMAWQGRDGSDYLFSYWTALGWSLLTFGIYGYYVFYQMVRRARDHNARRLELLDATLAFGWEQANRRGLQDELAPSFQRASMHLATLHQQTTEFRDPGIWLLLSIVGGGLTQIIAFILMDQDLVTHDWAEMGVEYEIAFIFGRLGHQLPYPDPSRARARHNYVGRVIATIATFGIYLLWWYYDMMQEGNRHFYTNWSQEDGVALAVQALQ